MTDEKSEFRHFLRNIPCVECEDQVDREEEPVGACFPLIPEEPGGCRDIDLEYHDTPPFAQVPVSQAWEHEIQEPGDEGIFSRPAPAAQSPREVDHRNAAFRGSQDGFPAYLCLFIGT